MCIYFLNSRVVCELLPVLGYYSLNFYSFTVFDLQECVNYCSKDVMSTLEVLQILWPMFLEHARDPITFMGMLEMGTAYLPINSSWKDYITRSESMYQKVTDELKKSLLQAAEDTLKLMIGKKYVNSIF